MKKPAKTFIAYLCNQALVVAFGSVLWFQPIVCAAKDNEHTPQYSSRVWQTPDGLPHNSVRAIAQTPDGYLWIGTQKGLARFDGVRFVVWEADGDRELKNVFVTALCEGLDGSLWIGTSEHGVIQLKEGRIHRFTERDGLADNAVRSLSETGDGLWVGTTRGLSRFANGTWTSFTAQEHADDVVRAICKSRDGGVWFDAGPEPVCWKNGVVTTLSIPRNFDSSDIRTLCEDKTGAMWIGFHTGLLRCTPEEFVHYTKIDGLLDNFVSTIYEDRHGTLWVGTYGGLNRMANGQPEPVSLDDQAGADVIHCIFEDREGSLWIGAKDGLIQLNARPFTFFSKQQGLTYHNVTSVCESKSGALWIGTWGGGLNQLVNGVISAYPNLHDARVPGLVLALRETRDGSLWLGTDFGGGVYRFKDGESSRFGRAEGFMDSAVRVIYEDRAENLWIGTSSGLNLWQADQRTRFTRENGLADNTIRTIHQDSKDQVWVGTEKGLSRWDGGAFVSFAETSGLPSAPVLAIHEDALGSLWLGTAGAGLYRWKDGKGAGISTERGLFSDDIHEILEDDHGFFWMSSPNGIFRVSRKNLEAAAQGIGMARANPAFGKHAGLMSIECSSVAKPSAWKGADGRLWFAMSKGLATIDPAADIRINDLPPAVVIEEVVFDKRVQSSRFKVQSPGQRAKLSSTLNFEPGTLNLPPGRGELEFHYTALSFTASEKNRFKYKLEGLDDDWMDAGGRRVAHYNNVPPGDYTFRVIACNNDGVWNSLGSSVKLALQPHYWQTWWFKCFAIIGSLSLAAVVVRYVTRKRMAQKLELLEHQHGIEKERARIARDMHDDFGSLLTRISLLSELAEADKDKPEAVATHIRKIAFSARKTVQSLDEIVWAVNPKNDTRTSLARYISHYANEFFENTNVRCRLEMPVDLPADTLSAELRHNLFLVVKEALNNILKHADASEARIQIAATPALEITITDNGRGFDEQQSANGRKRNGLENMRKRIETLHGQFEIQSRPGKGTKLRLSFETPFLKR